MRHDIDLEGDPPRSPAEVTVEDFDLMRSRLEREEVLSPGALLGMIIDDDCRACEPERPIEVEVLDP